MKDSSVQREAAPKTEVTEALALLVQAVPVRVELRDMLQEKPQVFGDVPEPGMRAPLATVQVAYVCNAVHALKDASVQREAAHELKELLADQVQSCTKEFAPIERTIKRLP